MKHFLLGLLFAFVLGIGTVQARALVDCMGGAEFVYMVASVRDMGTTKKEVFDSIKDFKYPNKQIKKEVPEMINTIYLLKNKSISPQELAEVYYLRCLELPDLVVDENQI